MKSIFAQNQDIVIVKSTPISVAIRALDSSSIKFLLVVDEDKNLAGTVTDGDVRRGILKGVALNSSIENIMNPNPVVATVGENPGKYSRALKKKNVFLLPVVDQNKKLVDLLHHDNLSNGNNSRDNPVLILAGGLGTRLGELTKDKPKSLMPIGNTPLIELTIQNLMRYGFHKFYVSLNYKADMIRESLGDGSRWKCDIQYLQEEERLGTAGPISMLQNKIDLPFLVMNGDIVTKIDFDSLFHFHATHKEMATMCVKEYDMQVPFGVVQLEENKVTQIHEKPVHKFFVSAGIYVFDPKVIKFVPEKTYFDMPNLFDHLLKNKFGVNAFPIMEYWIDIGRYNDLEKAQKEFKD